MILFAYAFSEITFCPNNVALLRPKRTIGNIKKNHCNYSTVIFLVKRIASEALPT